MLTEGFKQRKGFLAQAKKEGELVKVQKYQKFMPAQQGQLLIAIRNLKDLEFKLTTCCKLYEQAL